MADDSLQRGSPERQSISSRWYPGGSLLYMDYHTGEPLKISEDDDTRVHGDQVSAIGFDAQRNRLITVARNNLHFWKFESK